MSSSHIEVVLLDRIGEADGVGQEPAGAAVEREADLVAEHLLHRRHAVEHVVHAALADLALIHGAVIAGLLLHDAVVEVAKRVLHVGVERDALLDHEEALGLLHHPFDVGGIVLRPVAGALAPPVAVVAAHLVAHLAAEQLVDRHIGGLAGDVPQRVLDGADRGAIGLEAAALADLQHHALDVGRVLADQRIAEMQHPGLEVGLGEFHLAQAIDVLVGDDADDGVLADDGAAEVDDLHDGLSVLSYQLAIRPSASTDSVAGMTSCSNGYFAAATSSISMPRPGASGTAHAPSTSLQRIDRADLLEPRDDADGFFLDDEVGGRDVEVAAPRRRPPAPSGCAGRRPYGPLRRWPRSCGRR